ncbi:MAG: replicative DNA helicase [Clostridia bacterium]|nr:replicative DNA helicase [Clostridia bacterium]
MDNHIERKLPFSLEAEQSVLGSVLIDPQGLDTVTGLISVDDFYLEEHRSIYSAMQGMYLKSKNIDVVTLIDELVHQGVYDEAGGKEYLRLIAETVPTASNIKDYADIVRDKAIMRSLITACEDVTESAYAEEDEAQKLVELAESKIYAIAEQRENKNFVEIKDALLQVYAHLQQLITNKEETLGMQTGFSGLDRMIVGMGKSDLVLVGARPGMGKTAFALNLAVSAAKRLKKAVCIFSLEMSAEQLVTRLLSGEALVDNMKLRSGELSDDEWQRLAHASSELSETRILIDDTSGITVAAMMAKLRRVKDLGLVVVDYLGLMQSEQKRDNRVQEVTEISRNLKLMAKEFNVPVICCAQLNRGTESRTGNRPMLSDLRDSGAIEQDADIVMFLYRDEYYNKDADNPQTTAEVIVAKNRHGSTGTVNMGWLGRYTKFVTLDENASDTN